MKIVGLHIYGYGKFENMEVKNLSPSIQVFFGRNEAGKSTLMSFVLSILFGFPTKQQSEQRYEPKTSQSYGGKLIIDTERYGQISIERLPGKAIGDVSVQMKDGSIDGEAILHQLLGNMDRNYYQSIFSFNVHGLQEIHRIGADDLGRFLFSSGAIGTDALLIINQKLEKDLESLFKPNGRKPKLNMELQELKGMHQKVKKLQDKNDTYYSLIEEKESLQNELLQTEQFLIEHQRKINTLELIQSIKPLLLERNKLIESLQKLPSYEPFPENGLKRLDELLSQLQPYKTQLSGLNERKLKWEKKIKDLFLDEEILKCDKDIQSTNSLRKIYEENHLKLIQLTNVHKNKLEEIEQQSELIHINADEAQIMNFDTSLPTKEYIKQTTSTFEGLLQKKKLLDHSFNDAKEALEECDLKLKGYEKELLSEKEQSRLEEQYQRFKTEGNRTNDKESLLTSIEQIDRKRTNLEARKKEQVKKGLLLFSLVSLILLVFSFYLVSTQTWISGIIPFIFAILSPIIYYSVLKQSTNSLLSDLKEDKKVLMQKLTNHKQGASSFHVSDYEHVHMKLSKNSQLRQLVEVERAKLVQLERSYDRIVNQFEIWEREYYQVKQKLMEQCKKYRVPENSEHLIDILDVIGKLKQNIREKNESIKQMNLIKMQIKEFEKMIQAIGETCKVEVDMSEPIVVLERINQALKDQTAKLEVLTNASKKVEEIDEDSLQLQYEVNSIMKDLDELWKQANVETEEEFRRKGRAVESASSINERLLLLDAQISSYHSIRENWRENIDDEIEIVKVEQQLKQDKEKQKKLQHQLSETKIRLEELEEGGGYAEVYHDFQLNKSNFQEQAKDWAVLSVAKDLLTKTIQQYRDVRLPHLLKTAEGYLSILTNGTYVRVYPQEGKTGFIIERKDGMRFTPNELSQATSEQIYVAIRFALAKTIHLQEKVPFIIDDSFVNFDGERLQNVVMLLHEISKEHQVLFFTCHEHVVRLFEQQASIRLDELSISQL